MNYWLVVTPLGEGRLVLAPGESESHPARRARKGHLGGEEEEEEAVLYRDQQQDDARRPLPHLPLPRVEELRKERRQLVARKRDEDCVCEDGGYDEHVQQAEPGADA